VSALQNSISCSVSRKNWGALRSMGAPHGISNCHFYGACVFVWNFFLFSLVQKQHLNSNAVMFTRYSTSIKLLFSFFLNPLISTFRRWKRRNVPGWKLKKKTDKGKES